MTITEERPTVAAAAHQQLVTVKVRRYDPEVDPEANW